MKTTLLALTLILLSGCSSYDLQPKTVTIGLPEWLAKVSVTYDVHEKEKKPNTSRRRN